MKLIDVIFCDDIRYEVNNKFSLMGIYNDRIVFQTNGSNEFKWPLPFNLSVFLRFKTTKTGKNPSRFEFDYTLNSKNIAKINGEFNLDKNQEQIILAIIGSGVPLELGDLGFSIKLYDKDNLLYNETQEKAIKIMAN